MAGELIGKVQSIQGVVQVRGVNGKLRTLMVGDELHEGDTVITGAGGKLVIALADGGLVNIDAGQTVAMTAELSPSRFPGADEAQVAALDPLAQAVLRGTGELQTEETAAGPAGGPAGAGNDGHSFVQLLRVSEFASSNLGLTTTGLGPNSAPAQENLTLADAPPIANPDGNGSGDPVIEAGINDPQGDPDATGNLLPNDDDPDGDALIVAAVNGNPANVGQPVQGTYGSITVGQDGTYTYALDNTTGSPTDQLAAGEQVTDVFTYTVSDPSGQTSTSTVTITVTGANDAPIIDVESSNTNGSVTEDADEPTLTDSGTIVFDDVDFTDGHTVSATAAEGNLLGGTLTPVITDSATGNGSGVVTWTYRVPNAATQGLGANESVTETFTVTVSDGKGGTDTQLVTVVVNGANDAPDAKDDNATDADDDALTTPEDQALTISPATLLGNDLDPDGDTLTILTVQSPVNGTVSLVEGVITFTPNANYNGPASFTYTVSDGQGGTDTATVNINVTPVNDPPNADDDNATDAANDALTTPEDQALAITPDTLLANDEDIDGDTLTITSVQNPVNGTVSLVDGLITFTPNANYNGPASFTYTISDGQGGTDTATVNINVTPVIDPPTTDDKTVNGTEDGGPIAITLTGDDLDGTVTSFTINTLPDGGVLMYNGSPVSLGQVIPATAEAASVSFVPNANFNGTVNFTYSATDNDSPANTDASPATVTINVGAAIDPPTTDDKTVNGTEDGGPIAITLTGDDLDGTVTSFTINTLPDGGVLMYNGSPVSLGQVIPATAEAASVSFVPNANFNGNVSFTYSATDNDSPANTDASPATVTINVAPANDDPTISGPQSRSVSEEGLLGANADSLGSPDTNNDLVRTGTFTASDLDGDSLSFSLGLPVSPLYSNGQPISWTPSNGGATLTGTTGSGPSLTTIATLTITSAGFYTFTLAAPLDHPDGSVEDALSAAFQVTVSDGNGGTASSTLTVSIEDDSAVINSIQDAYVANTTGSVTGNIDVSFGADDGAASRLFISSYNEVSGLTYSLTNNDTTLTATVSGTGAVFYVMQLNQDGTYTLNYNERPSSSSDITFLGGNGGPGVETLGATAANGSIAMVFDGALYNGTALVNSPGSNGANANDDIKPTGTGFGVGSASDQTVMNNNEGFIVTFSGTSTSSSVTGFSFDITQQGSDATFTLNYIAYADGSAIGTPGSVTVTLNASQEVYRFELSSADLGDQSFDRLDLWFTGLSASGNVRIDDFSLDYDLFAPDQPLTFGVTAEDSDGDLSAESTFDVLLQGGAGPNYTLTGDSDSDALVGGAGNDVLIGGDGNDTLTGGGGSDNFVFRLADVGSGTGPSSTIDTITDFAAGSGGDKLDLRDLLPTVDFSASNGNLANDLAPYLSFSPSGSATTIAISSAGNGIVDQRIQLDVDITGGSNVEATIINNLLTNLAKDA